MQFEEVEKLAVVMLGRKKGSGETYIAIREAYMARTPEGHVGLGIAEEAVFELTTAELSEILSDAEKIKAFVEKIKGVKLRTPIEIYRAAHHQFEENGYPGPNGGNA